MIKVKKIGNIDKLLYYEPEWRRLSLECAKSVFQMPGWVIPWWKTFGGNSILHCILAFESKNLVGLAPLMIKNDSGRMVLRFIGAPLNDYNSFLTRNELSEDISCSIFEYLVLESEQWDEFEAFLVEDFQDAFGFTERTKTLGINVKLLESEDAPVIKLPSNINKYYASLPRKRVSRCDYYERRFWRNDLAEFRVYTDSSNIENHFDEFRKQRLRMWRLRGRLGSLPVILRTKEFSHFLHSAAIELPKTNGLHFALLRKKNMTVCSGLYFSANSRLTAYMFSWNYDYASLEPGTVLHWKMIKYAVEKGFSIFDWGRGDEPYKYSMFGAKPRPLHNAIVTIRPNYRNATKGK